MSAERKRGADLALQLLEACGKCSVDDAALNPEGRDGKPQHNVAAPFLHGLCSSQDAAFVEGFASVLSDVLVSAYDGGTQDVRYAKQDVAKFATTAPAGKCARLRGA